MVLQLSFNERIFFSIRDKIRPQIRLINISAIYWSDKLFEIVDLLNPIEEILTRNPELYDEVIEMAASLFIIGDFGRMHEIINEIKELDEIKE